MERATQTRLGELMTPPVAAAVKLEMGKLICANATGYAVEGSESATLIALGRAELTVDNTAGADGDQRIQVRRGTFKLDNSGTDPVDQSCLGKTVYIEDSQTVSKTDNESARSAAGTCREIDDDGIWVQVG